MSRRYNSLVNTITAEKIKWDEDMKSRYADQWREDVLSWSKLGNIVYTSACIEVLETIKHIIDNSDDEFEANRKIQNSLRQACREGVKHSSNVASNYIDMERAQAWLAFTDGVGMRFSMNELEDIYDDFREAGLKPKIKKEEK